jgi:outer membrane protein TolC
VSIGLPAGAAATVTDDVPSLRPLALEERAAVQLGLQRRLDLLTALDRRADAERNLRVARRGRLPDLNAYVEAATESAGAETWGGQVYEESQSAGLTLELPLDQRDERDAARRAALALAAADRAWRAQQDAVRLDIAESFSSLRTLRTSVEIEQRNIEVAEKRARNASLRFRNGELSNRDVIEAENDLLNARNAWVQALLDCELQRLQLLRNVGLLDVSPSGGLVELAAPAGPAAVPEADIVPQFEVVE